MLPGPASGRRGSTCTVTPGLLDYCYGQVTTVNRKSWGIRSAALGLCCIPALLSWSYSADAQEQANDTLQVTLFVDSDDDDDDGLPDRQLSLSSAGATRDILWIGKDESELGRLEGLSGGAVRVVSEHGPSGDKGAHNPIGLQGTHPGKALVRFDKVQIAAEVHEFIALDGAGNRVDLAASHASISRRLPRSLDLDSDYKDSDEDALRWLVVGPGHSLPMRAKIVSTRPGGEQLDEIRQVDLRPVACPSYVSRELSCRQTDLIRASADEIDRSHPDSAGRSLMAEVGGRISVMVGGRKAAAIRVGGPRHSRLGELSRYRGTLRTFVVRGKKGGPPPIGATDEEALELMRNELQVVSRLWGQCGIHFGADEDLEIHVVDPPVTHMLAVGCDLGLPASGGKVRFRVGGVDFEVDSLPGRSPSAVASRIAGALRAKGLVPVVSHNARTQPGALRTVDVLVRDRDGAPVLVEPSDGAPLSDDSTLSVCLGDVELTDGLTHFSDFDAAAGTIEERSLIKAFDDGDPTTIEVFVVPSFAKTGRIGESFILTDGASIQNTVLLDRAGLLAGARSYALAHELGHVLLDMPGHPDDYGVDQSTNLMDADAADSTIFGPRRLTVSECERALSQSGPFSPLPLLKSWPLYERATRASFQSGK